MKQCTYCGKEYPDEATACQLDGALLLSKDKEANRKCPLCGKDYPPEVTVCDQDGAELLSPNRADEVGRMVKEELRRGMGLKDSLLFAIILGPVLVTGFMMFGLMKAGRGGGAGIDELLHIVFGGARLAGQTRNFWIFSAIVSAVLFIVFRFSKKIG